MCFVYLGLFLLLFRFCVLANLRQQLEKVATQSIQSQIENSNDCLLYAAFGVFLQQQSKSFPLCCFCELLLYLRRIGAIASLLKRIWYYTLTLECNAVNLV